MAWLNRFILSIIRIPTQWMIKTKGIPGDIEEELGIDKSKPIVYLLRTNSITDKIALSMAAKSLALPDPFSSVEVGAQKQVASIGLEQPQSLISRKRKHTQAINYFQTLFELHHQHEDIDLQIVPVSIFWGRAPGKSNPGWSDLIADRASPSWLRKLFIVLFLGRDNFVVFSKAVSTKAMMQARESDHTVAHKLIRVARSHFYRRRQSFTGPSLVERHHLFNAVLAADSVKHAISDEARQKKISQVEARELATKYTDEIAADYREGLIRLCDRVLTKVWNKIYNGIQVNHAQKVRELAQNGHEIVYVPCHRSHMDYLLLTYVIYHEGLVTPHIAAGINLNIWPLGGIFRRAGAFFIRRSFANNKLYTAVFREYLEQLFNGGYSVKFYPEGGRSRTGRLLPPKTGMLAMTLQSMMKGINRPVTLVPVYIGYEHVMEVNTYHKELRGKSKEKESFFKLFSVVKKLRNYGTGFLNFGEPITLSSFLDQSVPDWRESDIEKNGKPSWLTPTVNSLGAQVMHNINQCSAASGMALVSTLVLASKRRTMTENELTHGLDHVLALFKAVPFSALTTLPKGNGVEVLTDTLNLDKFTVQKDSFGKLISLGSKAAVAQTYYRNNILHLFVIPGLIAAIIINHPGIEKSALLAILDKLYPLLKRELFIYMTNEQANEHASQLIDSMIDIGLVVDQQGQYYPPEPTEKTFYSFWLINRTVQETLQRYALVLTLLEKEQHVQRSALERQSQQLAARLSALHGFNAPEFYDKNVLATFVNALKDNRYIDADSSGLLTHSASTSELQNIVIQLVSPDIANSIQRIQMS